MRAKLWLVILSVAVLAVFVVAPLAGAGDMKTYEVKTRYVFHNVKVEVVKVDDVPGHVLGVVEAKGLSFLITGEVANYCVYILFDLTNGTGRHEGYTREIHEDGSIMISKFKGTTQAVEGGKTSVFKGMWTSIGGTGRFEGIQGGGTYSGKRILPVATGVVADTYGDNIGSYTLPSH